MAVGDFSRLHLFKAINHLEIVQNISQRAAQYLGIQIQILKSQISLAKFEKQRFGKYRWVGVSLNPIKLTISPLNYQ